MGPRLPKASWLALVLMLSSCGSAGEERSRGGPPDGPVAVETARAEKGVLADIPTYTGTTRPHQQIAVRAQTAGLVRQLIGDRGDAVATGAVVARLDGDVLTAQAAEEQAQLQVSLSELAQARVAISDAEAAVIQARATRDQAQVDAERLQRLAAQGASSLQAAEAAQLGLTNAEAALQSAQAQLQVRQQALTAAQGQVAAQRAAAAGAQEQLADVELRSQLGGIILDRLAEPGDYVQPGTALLEIGSLDLLEVTVGVSELDLGQLAVGQPASLSFDAFPDLGDLTGRITRISPVVDPETRLATVEVTLENATGQVGSGLLARVQFVPATPERVLVPESALADRDLIFVLDPASDPPTVTARPVTVGQRRQGQVEILSGLTPGESFVVTSDRPLEPDQEVSLSILSETGQEAL